MAAEACFHTSDTLDPAKARPGQGRPSEHSIRRADIHDASSKSQAKGKGETKVSLMDIDGQKLKQREHAVAESRTKMRESLGEVEAGALPIILQSSTSKRFVPRRIVISNNHSSYQHYIVCTPE